MHLGMSHKQDKLADSCQSGMCDKAGIDKFVQIGSGEPSVS